MRVYTVPDFNLTFDWWRVGNLPAIPPQDFHYPGQLYVESRHPMQTTVEEVGQHFFMPLIIRVDKDFVVTMGIPFVGSVAKYVDTLGDPWYYLVVAWERTHAGMPNEYLSIVVKQCDINGNFPDTIR